MKLKIIPLLIFFSSTSIFSQINWISQPIPPGIGILLTIDMPDSNLGFSGGWQWGPPFITAAGVYTTNGGGNWLSSLFPDSTRAFIYTKFFDSSNGIAVGAFNHYSFSDFNFKNYFEKLDPVSDFTKLSYAIMGYHQQIATGGIILKTQDGGKTWQTCSILSDRFTYITAGCFIDENTGFIVAPIDSLSYILKTTDGGKSWNVKFTLPLFSGSRSIVFSSPQIGIAVGYTMSTPEQEGLVAYTNDGGENWNYVLVPETMEMVSASFSDPNIFYAVCQAVNTADVFKSTDAGVTWIQTSYHTMGYMVEGIKFLQGTGSGMLIGSQSLNLSFVSKTNDYGINWSGSDFISAFPNFLFYGYKIFDENNVYLTGGNMIDSGLILKTSNMALPVEQNSYRTLEDNGFLLEQNYPNPFNPSTIISWQSPVDCQQTVKLYNILGCEIQTLFDGFLKAGRHSVEFNASLLPSGIYFYKLKARTFFQTKKMILLR